MSGNMNLTLKIWRQANSNAKGRFETYYAKNISPDSSFLEMFDLVNEDLEAKGQDPIAFEHDCREGICGCCGLVINGRSHGPLQKITTCQLHMRHFRDGEDIWIEPWRAKAFPIIKDLIVDRSALDKIIQTGGFVSVDTGGVPDANAILISKDTIELATDAAACIGCGACVATCKNASAMLFVGAKISQLALLPQGQPERYQRVQVMVKKMDELGFGNCSNTYACEVECPKGISISNIARMNRDYYMSKIKSDNVEV